MSLRLVALTITAILSLSVHSVSGSLDHASVLHHRLLLLLRHLIGGRHWSEAELRLRDEGHLTDDRVGSLVIVPCMLGRGWLVLLRRRLLLLGGTRIILWLSLELETLALTVEVISIIGDLVGQLLRSVRVGVVVVSGIVRVVRIVVLTGGLGRQDAKDVAVTQLALV